MVVFSKRGITSASAKIVGLQNVWTSGKQVFSRSG